MSSILSQIGAGLSGFSAGLADPSASLKLVQQRKKEQLEQQERQQLGNILAGRSTPEFLRPGGAEGLTPQQSQQLQLNELAGLATPESLKILQGISPLAQKPVTAASPLGKLRQDLTNKKITQEGFDKAKKKLLAPRAPLVQITSGEKAKTRTSRDQLTEGLAAVNELISKIEEDPTRAGILGFGRGIAETAGGVISDVSSFLPGFEGVQKSVEGLQPKLGESIRGLRPLQNKLASGLARSRFGDSGRIPVQQLELARKDVNIAEATSGRQTLDSLRQVRKELQTSLESLVGRAGEAGFDLPVKKSPVIKLDENFNIIQ